MVYRIPLRIVFYEESGSWIAHCLEFDLVGDGSEPTAALEVLMAAIETQLAWSLENNDPSLLFSPAPRECEVMFAAGTDVAEGELQIGLEAASPSPDYVIEPPRVRLYTGPSIASTLTAAS
ncbi:MAG: hypothetical protein AAF266_11410 [Planctomycetota bacterium]